MPPLSTNPSHLSELTVTCHQCGSASMDRLDRKEYRCTHCGAITIVSDDDADRLEELLREALDRHTTAPERIAATSNSEETKRAALLLLIIGVGVSLPLLLTRTLGHHSANNPPAFRENTVAAEDVTVSQLLWNKNRKQYEGTVYNHSGYPIQVPHYTITLFTNGHRSGSTWSTTEVSRLLPGEYEPISFNPHIVSTDPQPDRYELDWQGRIERSTDDIARPALEQQQLVHQQGKDFYQVVGIVRNTFTRPIGAPCVMVVLYGPDHQPLGSGTVFLERLRPGEDGIVDIKIYPVPKDAKVAAYEYLVDAAFTDSRW